MEGAPQRAESPPGEVLARLRLAVFDVDGVLTDGRVVYVGEREQQSFSVHDGQGLAWLRRAEVELAWITGRGSSSTECRARELGVAELHMHTRDKAARLQDVQERRQIEPAETVAMGDDLPDLAMRDRCALFVAPANARPEVIERADWVTASPGGGGAVRELCEAILRAKGRWDELLGG